MRLWFLNFWGYKCRGVRWVKEGEVHFEGYAIWDMIFQHMIIFPDTISKDNVHALYVRIIHIGCDWKIVQKMSSKDIIHFYPRHIIIDCRGKNSMGIQRNIELLCHWLVISCLKRFKIEVIILVSHLQVSLSLVGGRKSLFSLNYHTGSHCMSDIFLMWCILKKMFVLVLSVHYSMFLERVNMGYMQG